MEVCSCGTGPGNSGLPICFEIFDVTKNAIFGEYFNPDGTVKFIDSTVPEFTQVMIDALTHNRNSRMRGYPVQDLKNIEDLRGDNVNEEFEDGTTVFIRTGARTFTGWVVGADPEWIKQMNSWRCLNPGVWMVDKTGNLIGNKSVAGQLRMVRIQKGSFNVKLIKGTDTTVQKAEITFTIHDNEKDSDLGMITAENITADLLGAGGLIDVVGANIADEVLTGFAADLNTKYGSVNDPIGAEGIEATDVEIFNKNTSLAVVVATLVDDGSQNYTFTFVAQNASDVLEVRTAPADPIVKSYEIVPFEVSLP